MDKLTREQQARAIGLQAAARYSAARPHRMQSTSMQRLAKRLADFILNGEPVAPPAREEAPAEQPVDAGAPLLVAGPARDKMGRFVAYND